MPTSVQKRWPLTLTFRNEIEREIHMLQARLSCDPDERKEIQDRIDELKQQLADS